MYTHTCVRYTSSPGVTPWSVFAVTALPPFLWWWFVISFTLLFIDWGRRCDHRCFLHKSIKPYNTLCYLFSAMYTNLHIAQAPHTLNRNKHRKCTWIFHFFLAENKNNLTDKKLHQLNKHPYLYLFAHVLSNPECSIAALIMVSSRKICTVPRDP